MEKGKTGEIRMENRFNTINQDELTDELANLVNSSENVEKQGRLNIYLAGPWFTEKGALFYDAIAAIEKNVRPNSNYKVFYPKKQISKTPKDAFNNNVEHIKECDLLVALVTEKDVGTAWEIGMAYSMGKDVYLMGYDKTSFLSHTNVMLAFTGRCFTVDKWAKFLTQTLGEKDFVNIPNEWEGIE